MRKKLRQLLLCIVRVAALALAAYWTANLAHQPTHMRCPCGFEERILLDTRYWLQMPPLFADQSEHNAICSRQRLQAGEQACMASSYL
jgi:hypothetical protein